MILIFSDLILFCDCYFAKEIMEAMLYFPYFVARKKSLFLKFYYLFK